MLRSMYSGIGGMRNFQTKLDTIGNNISNVNTFGFKKGRTTFKDLVSQQLSGASTAGDNRGGTNPQQVGLGSSLASIDTIHTQGSLQTTGRDLDMGISGDGFFVVNDGDQSYYTRAGNFYLDEQGNLVNSDGLRVQGYGVDGDGNIDEGAGFGDLEITAGSLMAPQATGNAQFRGNLNADYVSGTALGNNDYSEQEIRDLIEGSGTVVPYSVVDSLGRVHDLDLVFQKTGENEWQVGSLLFDEDENEYTFTELASDLSFNNDGSFNDVDIDQLVIGGTDGSDDLAIDIDLSRMSQFARNTTADISNVDGNMDGTLESYNISETGEINGVFSNGEVRLLGQIGLANFNNPGGLSKSGDNLYAVSNNSGAPQLGFAGDGGRGTLTGAALEMSNVDLSEEFAEMIVSQRGFQANTRMITTSDEILQELVNLKR
ncbi:flagellar hook protein FlgE [Bacillus shivajii]|uniref:flagellar hook protein FlgE n=1 Tax=Bacillus shivajii TaxID=1983719 RepID=UPI001CF9A380|nr:flagellar hook protein FlgE [Bacillus shivajii]UCZ51719.1 flagellar hook protein FlgE [Bacillus shivajii]